MTRAHPERDFQDEVIARARANGWNVWHFHDSRKLVTRKNGARFLVGDADAKGFPDLVLAHRHRAVVLFRELKIPPNKLTPEQDEALRVLNEAGADAKMWTPKDWPEIIITLSRRKKNP